MWETGTWTAEANIQVGGELHAIALLNGGAGKDWMFVGFQAVSASIPDLPVGMVRGWNLANPAQAHEFYLKPGTTEFAATSLVTALAVVPDGGGNPVGRLLTCLLIRRLPIEDLLLPHFLLFLQTGEGLTVPFFEVHKLHIFGSAILFPVAATDCDAVYCNIYGSS